MCDYSLYTIQNRLAQQGEELVLHKFETGSLGFASASDLDAKAIAEDKPIGFWSRFICWLSPERSPRIPAVCIPPGSRLLLMDMPRMMQATLRVKCSEIVTFTELSDRSYSYRDAIVLPNGTRMLLQDLPEGIHVLVLSMSPEPSGKPASSEVYAA
jgi:hypothetical protein